MALRAVPDHPKFARLKAILGLTKGPTLGYLEATWHFAGRYTPHGNIGKYSDAEIEAWVEWDGEPGRLVEALVEAGWLDRNAEHRLVVHDYHQHADDAAKLAVKRSGRPFVTAPPREPEGKPKPHSNGHASAHRRDSVATESGLPEPVPGAEPVPEPEPDPSPREREKISEPRKPLPSGGARARQGGSTALPRNRTGPPSAGSLALQHSPIVEQLRVVARGKPDRAVQVRRGMRPMAEALAPPPTPPPDAVPVLPPSGRRRTAGRDEAFVAKQREIEAELEECKRLGVTPKQLAAMKEEKGAIP